MIIGIVGTIASGKDTVADYLATKGFIKVSLSDLLREIMKSEGEETTIPNMTKYGNSLRDKKGHGYLAKLALEKAGGRDVVISSIRQVGEVEFLRSHPPFYLIKVDAPTKLRFNRLQERGRAGDIKSIEELKEIEAKQSGGTGGAMNMKKCLEMADFEVINDGTPEQLNKKIDQLLDQLSKGEEKNGGK